MSIPRYAQPMGGQLQAKVYGLQVIGFQFHRSMPVYGQSMSCLWVVFAVYLYIIF